MAYSDPAAPWSRYVRHRARAKHSGIPFSLTFAEWWDLWKDKFHLRGRGAGRLVMCRKGDNGGYEMGNVYIATQEHNSSTKSHAYPHARPKLDEQDIPRIRDMLKAGTPKQRIGTYFGVSRNAIRQIDSGITWK